jgi:NTP pyrophosphatase (non-canonical NTP hydrolase)
MYEIEAKAEEAAAKYGRFASTHEALGVALEEWDELRAAVHSNALGSIEMECVDLAAVCLRMARHCRNGADGFVRRSTK